MILFFTAADRTLVVGQLFMLKVLDIDCNGYLNKNIM